MTDIAKFLPHDPPMVLLDELIDYQESTIQARVTLRKTSPFCNETGEIPSYIGLEYMAQAIAAWNGYRAHLENKKPQIGFLLGSRRLTLNVPCFKVGETLDIFGDCQYNDGEMASFFCWIEWDKKRVVEATLNVFQPSDVTKLNL